MRTFVAHGDIGRATLGRIPSGPNALRGMETMLAVLRQSDLPDQVVAYSGDLIGLFVGAAAFEDSLFRENGVGFDEMLRFVDDFRRYLESLPPERFPNLVELAGPLTRFSPDEDERFEFMLNVIVTASPPSARGTATSRDAGRTGRRSSTLPARGRPACRPHRTRCRPAAPASAPEPSTRRGRGWCRPSPGLEAVAVGEAPLAIPCRCHDSWASTASARPVGLNRCVSW